jgi:hypothetical protein
LFDEHMREFCVVRVAHCEQQVRDALSQPTVDQSTRNYAQRREVERRRDFAGQGECKQRPPAVRSSERRFRQPIVRMTDV